MLKPHKEITSSNHYIKLWTLIKCILMLRIVNYTLIEKNKRYPLCVNELFCPMLRLRFCCGHFRSSPGRFTWGTRITHATYEVSFFFWSIGPLLRIYIYIYAVFQYTDFPAGPLKPLNWFSLSPDRYVYGEFESQVVSFPSNKWRNADLLNWYLVLGDMMLYTCWSHLFTRIDAWSFEKKRLVTRAETSLGVWRQLFQVDLSAISSRSRSFEFGTTKKSIARDQAIEAEPFGASVAG